MDRPSFSKLKVVTRMQAMNLFKAGDVDVRIDLRRADVGMTEKLLNRADIRTMREHVRSKAMSENMRRDPLRSNAHGRGAGADDSEDALPR